MTEIKWLSWSRETLERSKIEQKPILLSISAFWCQQCRQMDNSVFADPKVAEFLNNNFISVRADADLRPDLVSRYGMGSLPSNTFLTARGKVMAGGTYIPVEKMLSTAAELSSFYVDNQEVIESPDFTGVDGPEVNVANGNGEASWGFVEGVLDAMYDSYDSRYGGFSRPQKRVLPQAILLSLSSGLWGYEDKQKFGSHTLRAIYSGKVRDRIEEGFYRYSAKRDWSAPHFEKVLETNAWLMQCYLAAYATTGIRESATAAREIAEYLDTVLWMPHFGLYASSQEPDADYFGADAAGRRRRTPPALDDRRYLRGNSIAASGLMHFWWVMGSQAHKDRALAVAARLRELVDKNGACKHYQSQADDQLEGYLGDQALAATMLCEAYQVSGDEGYLEAAKSVVSYCERNLIAPLGAFYDLSREHLTRHSVDPHINRDDNALLSRAYVMLWGLTGDESYVDRARHVVDALITKGEPTVGEATLALSVGAVLRPVSVEVASESSQMAIAAKRAMIPSLAVQYDKSLEDTSIVRTPGDKTGRLASAQELVQALHSALNPRLMPLKAKPQLPQYQRPQLH